MDTQQQPSHILRQAAKIYLLCKGCNSRQQILIKLFVREFNRKYFDNIIKYRKTGKHSTIYMVKIAQTKYI